MCSTMDITLHMNSSASCLEASRWITGCNPSIPRHNAEVGEETMYYAYDAFDFFYRGLHELKCLLFGGESIIY